MNPENYNMPQIFGPGGPQSFNPNMPNQPPNVVYPNQAQNIPPSNNYPPQEGYPQQSAIPPNQYPPQQGFPPQTVNPPQQGYPPQQFPPQTVYPAPQPQQGNIVAPDPNCKKCKGTGIRNKHGENKKCKCVKHKEKELQREQKKEQKKLEKSKKSKKKNKKS